VEQDYEGECETAETVDLGQSGGAGALVHVDPTATHVSWDWGHASKYAAVERTIRVEEWGTAG
jgi:hypothetical protein